MPSLRSVSWLSWSIVWAEHDSTCQWSTCDDVFESPNALFNSPPSVSCMFFQIQMWIFPPCPSQRMKAVFTMVFVLFLPSEWACLWLCTSPLSECVLAHFPLHFPPQRTGPGSRLWEQMTRMIRDMNQLSQYEQIKRLVILSLQGWEEMDVWSWSLSGGKSCNHFRQFPTCSFILQTVHISQHVAGF